MNNVACLLFALSALAGCVTGSDVEDGRDDTFLGGDGKSDTGSVVEGSPDALAVLQVANERGAEEMHDHGVPKRAADNIVAVRVGDDGVAGTSDDVTFTTLAQLDAVPYVGPLAFARLLAYANELAGMGSGSGTGITPPADMWNVAACTPVSWSQLVAKFGPGATRVDFHRPFVTATRHRNSCNSVTGCEPWVDNMYAGLWLDDGPGPAHFVTMPTTTRGDVSMGLDPATTGLGLGMDSPNIDADFRFDCTTGLGQNNPTWTSWSCSVYGNPVNGNAGFDGDPGKTNPAVLDGRVCADGSFHFVTTLLNDDSSSLQNLEQIALYGQLF